MPFDFSNPCLWLPPWGWLDVEDPHVHDCPVVLR